MRIPRNYQSPYTQDSFKEYLQNSVLELVACWKLVSKSGEIVGATAYTRDITLAAHPNVVFKTVAGIIPSAADMETNLGSAGIEIEAIFQAGLITEEEISAGLWDAADFEAFIINPTIPEMGEMVLFAGHLGQVSTYDTRFTAEGRPLVAKAGQSIGYLTAQKCDVRNLGDARCKVNLNDNAAGDGLPITVFGTVTSSGNLPDRFEDINRAEPQGYFDNGKITFLSGRLAGREVEVQTYNSTSSRQTDYFITDTSWKVATSEPAVDGFGRTWLEPAYIDASWNPAFPQASLNDLPWQGAPNFTYKEAKWIWSANTIGTQQTTETFNWFRKTFVPVVDSARIVITADNEFELWVNGTGLGSGTSFRQSYIFTVPLLRGELNVVSVKVKNLAIPAPMDNPAGLIAQVVMDSYTAGGEGGEIILQSAMSFPIEAGTAYRLVRGCNRTFANCKEIYGNVVNFRGFPVVPGIEKTLNKKFNIFSGN